MLKMEDAKMDIAKVKSSEEDEVLTVDKEQSVEQVKRKKHINIKWDVITVLGFMIVLTVFYGVIRPQIPDASKNVEMVYIDYFNSLSAPELWKKIDTSSMNSQGICMLKGKTGTDESWGDFTGQWGLYTCYRQNSMESETEVKGTATVTTQIGELYTIVFHCSTGRYEDVWVTVNKH